VIKRDTPDPETTVGWFKPLDRLRGWPILCAGTLNHSQPRALTHLHALTAAEPRFTSLAVPLAEIGLPTHS
jgi:hypothetical protein